MPTAIGRAVRVVAADIRNDGRCYVIQARNFLREVRKLNAYCTDCYLEGRGLVEVERSDSHLCNECRIMWACT